MIKFNKSTLTEIAGLGAGAVAGAYVTQKVLTKSAETKDASGAVVPATYLVGSGKTGKLIADAAPIVVGLLLQGQSNLFAKEAGKGMIAQAAGSLIKSNVVPGLGLGAVDGYDYSAGTMMSGLDTGVDNPMISAVPGDNSYVAPSIGAAYYDDGSEAAY
jgi:hypothetical protein